MIVYLKNFKLEKCTCCVSHCQHQPRISPWFACFQLGSLEPGELKVASVIGVSESYVARRIAGQLKKVNSYIQKY